VYRKIRLGGVYSLYTAFYGLGLPRAPPRNFRGAVGDLRGFVHIQGMIMSNTPSVPHLTQVLATCPDIKLSTRIIEALSAGNTAAGIELSDGGILYIHYAGPKWRATTRKVIEESQQQRGSKVKVP